MSRMSEPPGYEYPDFPSKGFIHDQWQFLLLSAYHVDPEVSSTYVSIGNSDIASFTFKGPQLKRRIRCSHVRLSARRAEMVLITWI
jgi:hypothetical protein